MQTCNLLGRGIPEKRATSSSGSPAVQDGSKSRIRRVVQQFSEGVQHPLDKGGNRLTRQTPKDVPRRVASGASAVRAPL
jgi:hypothetical protein